MAEPRQRLDKWLWFARVTKSRTLAQKLILAGRVRINREKADSAADSVKPDDVLTIALESQVRVLKVLISGSRRGPPSEARLLYAELTPPDERPEILGRRGPRPTKRDRRRIDRIGASGDADAESFFGDGPATAKTLRKPSLP